VWRLSTSAYKEETEEKKLISKAFLLAAGEGRRLRPLTEKAPKCLLPIKGRPLIEYWMDLFEKYGITEVLINTHHLASAVDLYLKLHKRKNIDVTTYYESKLLGSGGTIKANKKFVVEVESFFICYADNLTEVDLKTMEAEHFSNRKAVTIGVFRTNTPQDCGVFELSKNNEVIGFEEKPAQPKSDLAAAGIYIARKEIFDFFPKRKIFDLGKDIFPKMIDQIAIYEIKEYHIDIGTIEKYNRANR
jgi:mannose-1-phosphate guanylyltransferase